MCSEDVTRVLAVAYHDVFAATVSRDQCRVMAFPGELREGDAALAVRIYPHHLPELDLGRKDRTVAFDLVLSGARTRREVDFEHAVGVCGEGGRLSTR